MGFRRGFQGSIGARRSHLTQLQQIFNQIFLHFFRPNPQNVTVSSNGSSFQVPVEIEESPKNAYSALYGTLDRFANGFVVKEACGHQMDSQWRCLVAFFLSKDYVDFRRPILATMDQCLLTRTDFDVNYCTRRRDRVWICNIRAQIAVLHDTNYLAMLMNVDELANQCYEDIGKALRIVKRSYHELLKLRIQSNISIADSRCETNDTSVHDCFKRAKQLWFQQIQDTNFYSGMLKSRNSCYEKVSYGCQFSPNYEVNECLGEIKTYAELARYQILEQYLSECVDKDSFD